MPSPVAGVLAEQLVREGDTVAVGAVIARIDEGATRGCRRPAQAAAAATTNPPGQARRRRCAASSTRRTPRGREPRRCEDHVTTLSPAVRRAVLEYHVDPTKIRGTGKDGRLTKDDVIAAAEAQKRSAPAQPGPRRRSAAPAARSKPLRHRPRPAPGSGEREERVKMSRLRQTVARRLKEAQNTAAMLTTFNDVDMTAVIEARARYKELFEKKHGIRLGFMGFFVKACALAANDVPSVNACIDGEEIVYHDYLDVSVAVSAPKGWSSRWSATPTRMSFAEIEKTIADFGKRAKDGTLTVDEMRVAPSPSPTAACSARCCRRRSSTRRNRRCSACTGSRSGRWSRTARSSPGR